jgi:hypothetical protein
MLTYVCEEAFFQMKIFKSRYRSRLTDEHLKHCFHLCPSTYERSYSKLSQDTQYHAITFYISYKTFAAWEHNSQQPAHQLNCLWVLQNRSDSPLPRQVEKHGTDELYVKSVLPEDGDGASTRNVVFKRIDAAVRPRRLYR